MTIDQENKLFLDFKNYAFTIISNKLSIETPSLTDTRLLSIFFIISKNIEMNKIFSRDSIDFLIDELDKKDLLEYLINLNDVCISNFHRTEVDDIIEILSEKFDYIDGDKKVFHVKRKGETAVSVKNDKWLIMCFFIKIYIEEKPLSNIQD